ncbi:hypothetical protein SDRG_05206 [Saprolegnia diclina VS20]|uniref:Uncharacterized protein n=1 Tax=Saprolegnia diclina (strain VS20) TaxID=1156394 RepID=T0S4H4_SAPDV|nr:hypothetical protein SDRG_05206 [Saprolegnia diclina VS20]EQC37612.1 hypothetical protein SDRG_05206 [Saprolegnia diclina VS20]|eukprot:XP_008609132.1 hypothetical protein SDRG_05206 [Saprolegnia diclina VS20]
MDRKVVQYCRFPGLRYVLCIFVSPDMGIRDRRLLALPNEMALPGRFPPELVLDVHPILEDASLEE